MMTKDRTNERYIPPGYQKVLYKEPVDAVAYVRYAGVYPKGHVKEGQPFPLTAMFFSGKRGKPDWHYRFKNIEELQKTLIKGFEHRIAHETRQKERKQKASAYEHTLKVGEMLVST